MQPSLGFIGTGYISSVMITGLCSSQNPPEKIIVSPRNSEQSAQLADKFSQVRIAQNNQEVLDNSEWIFLALRPDMASSVLPELQFRPEQVVISVMAIITQAEVKDLVQPVQEIYRAVPLPPAARQLGPLVYYPQDKKIANLLQNIGQPIGVKSERELLVLWALTALIAPYFGLMHSLQDWAVSKGTDKDLAADYIASMFYAHSVLATEGDSDRFEKMVADLALEGSLNEQALQEVRANAFPSFGQALDSVLKRLGVNS
jgi:pyrroline-5-carboxylate reductase